MLSRVVRTTGGKALVVAKLHRKHRGDGGRRTALQQQNDLCGHAAEAQQPEHRQADGGDQQHAHSGQLPHRLAAHDAAQVPGGKEPAMTMERGEVMLAISSSGWAMSCGTGICSR